VVQEVDVLRDALSLQQQLIKSIQRSSEPLWEQTLLCARVKSAPCPKIESIELPPKENLSSAAWPPYSHPSSTCRVNLTHVADRAEFKRPLNTFHRPEQRQLMLLQHQNGRRVESVDLG
jgi:hypothetical protein